MSSPLSTQKQAKRGMTAEDWQPILQKALSDYVLEQKGAVTVISTQKLLKYMSRKGYLYLENEKSVSNIINAFLSKFFGPLWDGTVYLQNRSVGHSILVGTDNILDLLKYRAGAK